ncbi:MAG TPA: AraC family transcriptional regulator [Xanthobacteraceae bacterium]
MPDTIDSFPTFRFTTDAVPERDRHAAFREFYGREVLRLEIEPLGDMPFRNDMAVRLLPGLGIVSASNTPFRVGRTRELLTDGNDSFIVQISTTAGVASQLGREVAVAPGDAIVLSNADVGHYTFPLESEITALNVPRAALGPLLRDPDAVLVRAVPRATPALRLLMSYTAILREARALATPELGRIAVTHVYDLLAVALGATREADEMAQGRGIRAARLSAFKADIAHNLCRPDLTVTALARRHGVSPRYVQMLFETESTTFSEFVRDTRLARAHQMLTDPRCAGRTVSAIAYEIGFGDLSHFNHVFRQRYGVAPSEVRAAAPDST